jgi:hypothetical protein
LENQQNVIFNVYKENEDLQKKIEGSGYTKLVAFFANNKKELEKNLTEDERGYYADGTVKPHGFETLYNDYPLLYIYKGKKWHRRKKKSESIGRMHLVHPKSGEKYYLRILLNYVAGFTGYPQLYIHERTIYKTIKEVCFAREIIQNTHNVDKILEEASYISNSEMLFNLYLLLLRECCFQDAYNLFMKYSLYIIHDKLYLYKRRNHILNDQSLHITNVKKRIINYYIYKLCCNLEENNFSYYEHGFEKPDLEECFDTNQLYEIHKLNEIVFNPENSEVEYKENYDKMNNDQKYIFDYIMESVSNEDEENNVFFIDAPGGTGKSFICKTIIKKLNASKEIGIVCASSGIAANNFENGRTAHSLFKIPINIFEDSTCNLTMKMEIFKLIEKTKIIIWDEAPMFSKKIFECVDRTLKSLFDNDKLFGGVNMLFCGDFRQVAPIIHKSSVNRIIDECLNKSYIWKQTKIFKLYRNERILAFADTSNLEEETKFYEFQLRIGEDKEEKYSYKSNKDCIEIPKKFISKSEKLEEFIQEIYCQFDDDIYLSTSFDTNMILTPKNTDVRMVNTLAIKLFPGEEQCYESYNTLEDENQGSMYPLEYLNTLEVNGLPSHKLLLKIGAPIMILRNLDPKNGICNGTRGIITRLKPHLIQMKYYYVKERKHKFYNIPRIILKNTDKSLPICFKRKQFPISLSFVSTINKCQGRTLEKCGLYLPIPVFGHGQLYVAFSRVKSVNNFKVYIEDEENQGYDKKTDKYYCSNIVYKNILN